MDTAAERTLDITDLTVDLPAGADRRHAIEGLSLTLHAGEILCIVGESGSGKSMTAHAILGLLPPGLRVSSGSIRLAGEELLGRSEAAMRQIRGRRAAMIFQEPMSALNPLMQVGQQIDEALRFHTRLTPAERRRRMLALLRDTGLPEPEVTSRVYPFQLSGGQRQRVMIAIALALQPVLLIADEPTTALDVTTQAQILDLIRILQERRNMGVLFITHDFGVVAEIAHRVAVMQQGKLVEIGTTGEVLKAPRHPYTQRLIAAVPRLIPRRRAVPPAEPFLAVAGLEKTYTARLGLFGRRVVPAVRGAALQIARGETLGLVGESGSGKSTVGRLLVRLVDADAGTICIDGHDIAQLRAGALKPYRRRIQIVFQDPFASLNPRRSVRQILCDGMMAHGAAASVAVRRAASLLELVGLDPGVMARYPHEFSGGQRQRIGIARALALDPEVLIADEPVSALDVSVQEQILKLLNEIQQRLALAILFITHDLRVAAQVCDRIAVMRHGEIVECATTERIFETPSHPYTRDLLAAVPGRAWQGSIKKYGVPAAEGDDRLAG